MSGETENTNLMVSGLTLLDDLTHDVLHWRRVR